MNVPPVASQPETPPVCPGPAWRRAQALGQPALVLILALVFLTLPVPAPDNSVDASLGAVLSHAHQQHWQHGRDIVFTYGPLGFLMFFYYTPHLAALRLVVDLALCLSVATGLVRLAWRMPVAWRWLFLGYFSWVAPNLQGRGDFILNAGLCCWALLGAAESGRRLSWAAAVFTALAAFAAAAKLSFLVSATVLTVLVAADLWFRRERRIAAALLLGYAVLFLVAWVSAGQHLANIPAFCRNAMAVVDAYNHALGFEGLWPVILAGIFTGGALLAAMALRAATAFQAPEPHVSARRIVLLAWCSLLGLTSWKHGFVRQDHAFYFLAFAPVLALALEGVPSNSSRVRAAARLSTLLVCLGGVTGLAWAQFPEFGPSLRQPFRSLISNTRSVIFPSRYWLAQEEALRVRATQSELPDLRGIIGNSTVDVFGQSQAYALNNGLNFRPRPVFQSYVACSRALMELNERFYLAPTRPEYVLLTMEPLDSKVAALEDARVLRELLVNYRHVATEGRYLLCRAAAREPVRLQQVSAGRVRLGERISLEATDSPLWIELTLKPSLLGHLRRLLLRPPVTRLTVWGREDALLARRRAPASMLQAGFLVSPFILNQADLPGVFRGEPGRRPGACAVEVLPGEEEFWRHGVDYRVYQVAIRPGTHAATSNDSRGVAQFAPPESSSTRASSPRPFKLFRTSRWRPDQPPIGGWGEQAALGLFAVAPLCCLAALAWVGTRLRTGRLASTWKAVAAVNLLLFLTLCSLLLLAGEIYYRFIYDTTDALGYTKVSERWVTRHWKLNSAGCRDDIEYAPAIAPGKRRVTFVGDSFTAGHGIPNVEDRLVNLWRRKHPEWETHALSNVGLNTGGELAMLKKAVALGYQLDQVVLVYCLNDVGDLVSQEAAAFEGALAGVTESGWLPRNSYFANLWFHRFRARQTDYVEDYHTWTLKAYKGEAWHKQMEQFKAIRDFVRTQGGHLAVVTYPFFDVLGPDYPYAQVHIQLHQAWISLGVPHLDLLPVYQGLQAKQLMVNPRDAHPNEKANQLAADALLRWADSLPIRAGNSQAQEP